ncbi:dephospho-CoA kinase [Rhizobium sp. RU20A]|uniref:dephospho-CoA kinase n=1 Tax=Rhizobium sp. RU20A TaxID=1907412 RepID=UPI0009563ADD|nr:dephospho-CoA kinase [Rhizobium sp. RU20A]SIQ84468.1 dephospho-CoA kinase [Rhizobium sp. RU20A]
MILLGLTGSIGTGKSTTAAMFRDQGIAVSDADAIVHDLYRTDAVAPIAAAFREAVQSGIVDRSILSRLLAENPARFRDLEAIVHPMVRDRERAFVDAARRAGDALVVVDVPLLFETGARDRVNKVLVVTCAPDIQRQRVLGRPGMTPEKFEMIRARQVPDTEKISQADFVIDTGLGYDAAREAVAEIIEELTGSVGGEGKTDDA